MKAAEAVACCDSNLSRHCHRVLLAEMANDAGYDGAPCQGNESKQWIKACWFLFERE
jgi:hypothetical protein